MSRRTTFMWMGRLLLAVFAVAAYIATPVAGAAAACGNCATCSGEHCCATNGLEAWEYCYATRSICVEGGSRCDEIEY